MVILGAGYGGLVTALNLEEKVKDLEDVTIILVDRNDYHQYLHLSYEIVTSVKKISDLTLPLDELLEKTKIQFYQATIESIDLINKTVRTNRGVLCYFELVIALGSEPDFFNIKGLENRAFCVCSVEAAAQLRDEIKKAFERNKKAKVVLCGGGFTGVELAGEIADELKCCVTIVEGAKMLLPTWDIPEFSNKVAAVLTDMGAELILNKTIVDVKSDSVVLSDGTQIRPSIFVWTAGVRGSHIASESGLKTGKSHRAVINEFCEAVGFHGVYVVGDCALVTDSKTGEILPQCIEIALQQAKNVAKNVYADVVGSARTIFVPKFSGFILAVGEKYGVGRVAGVKVEGRLALMVKKVVHLHYVYEISGIAEVLERVLS